MRNKYGAKKAKHKIGGIEYVFDSRAEQRHFLLLCNLLKKKKINNLRTQPRFTLQEKIVVNCMHTKKRVSAVSSIHYTADFSYLDDNKRLIVVEIKGVSTESFSIRKRLFIKSCQDKKEGFAHVSEYRIIYKDKEEIYFFDRG